MCHLSFLIYFLIESLLHTMSLIVTSKSTFVFSSKPVFVVYLPLALSKNMTQAAIISVMARTLSDITP